MKKIILAVTLVVQILFGDSYFEGNIIDIGNSNNTVDSAVQMIWEQYPAQYELLGDIVYTKERYLSPKQACITDSNGYTTCPINKVKCVYVQDSVDGSATPHNSVLKIDKICPLNTVRIGDSCYLDDDANGVQDNREVIKTVLNQLGTRVLTNNSDWNYCNKFGSFIDAGSLSGNCTESQWQSVLDCLGTTYLNYSLDAIRQCEIDLNITSIFPDENTSYCFGNDTYAWGANAVIPNDIRCPLDENVTTKETVCPNNFKIDGQSCYTTLSCPAYAQENNSTHKCEMNYMFYTYDCPKDVNAYGKVYTPKEIGSDCGGKCPGGQSESCLCNDPQPPKNNCVRDRHSCPFDQNAECTMVDTQDHTCPVGFVYKNDRCERVEPYCGMFQYDDDTDSCYDVLTYAKICTNSSDIYDAGENLCLSNNKACPIGKLNRIKNICEDDYEGICSSPGYNFDPVGETCINPNLPICQNKNYVYSTVYKTCMLNIKMCSQGYIYNTTTKNCEQIVCNILETHRNGSRCETKSLCDGTMTPDGNCIPFAAP